MRSALILMMHIAVTTALVAALSSCTTVFPGLFPPTIGTRIDIDCSRGEGNCLTVAEVEHGLALFAEEYPDFNVHLALRLEVFPYGKEIYGRSWAEMTWSRVRLSRLIDLPHELVHVMHWRRYPVEVDYNHEVPPGPWTIEDNVKVNRVKLAYMMAFPPSSRGTR